MRFMPTRLATDFDSLTAYAVDPAPRSNYTITPYLPPAGVKLEVTGIPRLPEGRLAGALRKGEIWLLEHPDADPANPDAVGYRRVPFGLPGTVGLLVDGGGMVPKQHRGVPPL